MGQFTDLSGMRFGRLSVISRAENDASNRTRWLCKCDCGSEKIARSADLKSGKIVSCGCQKRERCSQLIGTRGRTIHNSSGTRLYWVWMDMKKRCCTPTHKNYDRYGGRGITVCDEWKHDFVAFRDWAMNHGYAETLQIDRKDNDKGYSPDNCRWVTAIQNNQNRSSTVRVQIGNEEKALSEWAEIFGLSRATVYQRRKVSMDLNYLFAPTRKED